MSTALVGALKRLGMVVAISGIAAGALAADDNAAQSAPQDTATAQQGAAPQQTRPGPPRGPMGRRDGGGRFGPQWHPGGPGRGGPGGRGAFARMGRGSMPGLRMNMGLLLALHQLDLTPVQREQARVVVFNAQESVRMRMAQERQSGAAEQDRNNLSVLSNPGDPNYARALQQLRTRETQRVQQAIQLGSDTEQKLYDVLTSAQKAQLPKVLADMQARRQQRVAMRTQRERRDRQASPAPGQSPAQPAPPPEQR
jgi:Spy/CpxP family protein refolding chaperone